MSVFSSIHFSRLHCINSEDKHLGCYYSVRNNSLSQDIFRRKTLFVSACLYLYGNNVQMKLRQTKSKGYWKLLIYSYNVKSSINFNTMSRQLHLCPCKFYYILTVHQPMFQKLFCMHTVVHTYIPEVM